MRIVGTWPRPRTVNGCAGRSGGSCTGASACRTSRAAARVVRRAVPFEGTCLLTTDPATLLPTGAVVEEGLPDDVTPRLTQIELLEPDFNKFTALARARTPAAGLSVATAGDLDRSLRQRELRRPSGFADELRAVLPGPAGIWATLTLLREAGSPHFTATEVAFVTSLAGPLAEGVRRATLLGAVRGGDDADTGLLMLAGDDTVESANAGADHWLDELGAGTRLPLVVRAVAARARHSRDGDIGWTPWRGPGSARRRAAGWSSADHCATTESDPGWTSCWSRPVRPSWRPSSRRRTG